MFSSFDFFKRKYTIKTKIKSVDGIFSFEIPVNGFFKSISINSKFIKGFSIYENKKILGVSSKKVSFKNFTNQNTNSEFIEFQKSILDFEKVGLEDEIFCKTDYLNFKIQNQKNINLENQNELCKNNYYENIVYGNSIDENFGKEFSIYDSYKNLFSEINLNRYNSDPFRKSKYKNLKLKFKSSDFIKSKKGKYIETKNIPSLKIFFNIDSSRNSVDIDSGIQNDEIEVEIKIVGGNIFGLRYDGSWITF